MRTMTSYLTLGLGLFLLANPVQAQNCDPDLPLDASCTLKDIKDSIRAKAFPKDEALNEIQEDIVNTNKATTSPDPFASQLHASYQDYLNLLSFAVNQVEETEDGQALVIRFNPLRKQPLLIGSSLTLTKPSIADFVSDAIPSDVQDDTLEKIKAEQDGLSDQTWSISLSPATRNGECSWDSSSRCWGRAPSTYYNMLSSTLGTIAESTVADNEGFLFAERISNLRPSCTGLSCTEAQYQDAVKWNAAVDIVKALAMQEIAQAQEDQKYFKESGIELLSMLIDNQPQFSLIGSYRNRDRFGGPDEYAATVELQFGLNNLNDIKGECGADNCAQTLRTLKMKAQGIDSTKFVLTASYRQQRPFSLQDLALDTPVTGFMPIDRAKITEIKARLQGGWDLSAEIAGKNTRLDVALDGIRTGGDIPDKDKQNRWVGTATFTMPLGERVSMPVTVTYANKPEFLGEQKEQFGMHLGLSWRLPFTFNPVAGNVSGP